MTATAQDRLLALQPLHEHIQEFSREAAPEDRQNAQTYVDFLQQAADIMGITLQEALFIESIFAHAQYTLGYTLRQHIS